MLILSLMLNCLIVFPLTWALLTQSPGMDVPFGPDSPARRILACLYGTIGVVSAYALLQAGFGQRAVAVQIALVLFPLQILYKIATLPVIGISSPVVVTNLGVVIVLGATLISLRA